MIPVVLAIGTLGPLGLLLVIWCGRGRVWRCRDRTQWERISGLTDENHTLHRDLVDTQADRDFVIGRWWQTERERDHARADAHGWRQVAGMQLRRLTEVSAELAAERQKVLAVDELAAKRVQAAAGGSGDGGGRVRGAKGRFAKAGGAG